MATVVEGGRDPRGVVTPRPQAPVSGPELASTPLVIRRREDEETVVTFPYLVWREFLAGLAAFCFLLLVSIQINAPLLSRANTSITPNPAKAPWYFVGLQELLERFPPIMAGVAFPSFVIIFMILTPYLDRNPSRRPQDRKVAIVLFTVYVCLAVAFVVIGEFFRGEAFNWDWTLILGHPGLSFAGMRTRILFVALSVVLLGLVGWAAFKDSTGRTYITIQEQYLKDYPSSDFNVEVQQLFPSFPQATIEGDTYRVERCISCHVPDIGTIGPVEAAQRLSQDFFKYEPDAKQLAAEYHLTGIHPAYVTATGGNYPPSMSYAAYGQDGFTSFTYTPYTPAGAAPAKPVTVEQPGPLPSFLNPSTDYGSTNGPATGELGIDQIGCIVCHNGNRLSVDEADAHQNLVINPEYDFTEGAQLYYQNCARCHGGLGEGGAGPPLNNQDRLGYYNEDYYYRCIMYGFTGFEHYGSIMPNWGGIASDYNAAANPPGPGAVVNTSPVLSQTQINVLIQFIRQWEDYSTLP